MLAPERAWVYLKGGNDGPALAARTVRSRGDRPRPHHRRDAPRGAAV